MKIKSFKEFLAEAVDYKSMFNIVYKNTDKAIYSNIINEEIEWSTEILKKNYRIQWWLKWIRLSILLDLNSDDPKVKKELSLYSDLLSKERERNVIETLLTPSYRKNTIHARLKHFYDLHIEAIDNYSYDNSITIYQLFNIFDIMEQKWAEERKGKIPYLSQPLAPEGYSIEGDADESDYIYEVMKFDDGFYWVDLNTHYCSKEADAMGHCGTADRDSTLISLRYLDKRNNIESTWTWEPHVTFELTEDHMLTQMKGKANEKPEAKYHKYIVALLTHKIEESSNGETGFYIKGIPGEGYRAETNFNLHDLGDEEAKRVISINPNLDITNLVIKRFGDRVKVLDNGNTLLIKGFELYSTKNSSECDLVDLYEEGSSRRESVSKDMVKSMCTGETFDITSWDIPRRNLKEILSDVSLTNKNIEMIIAYLNENEPDWQEETDDWEEYLLDNDVYEVEDAIKTAYLYSEEYATEADMIKDFEDAVDSSKYIIFNSYEEFSLQFDKWKDEHLLRNLIENGNPNSDDSYEDKEVFWTWDAPYYGWSGSVTNENFNEQLSEQLSQI